MFEPIQVAPKQILQYVIDFCRTISPDEPFYVPIIDTADCIENECIWNVRRSIEKNGGKAILGWNISEWYGVMLEATFHVLWQKPTGELIDITPNEANKDRSLFLPDNNLVYKDIQIESIFKPLISDSRLDEFILNQGEIFKLENTDDRALEHGVIILSQEDADRRGYLQEKEAELMLAISSTKPGRNDYCRCGSGCKYKKCHGK